jgi:NitT/TauT family transport system permease protein
MAEDALLRLEAVLLLARRRQEWRRRLSTVLAPSLAVLVLLLFWEYGARLFAIPPYLLPGPQVVLASMRENAAALWTQGLVTTWEIVLGFALSVAVGLPLALAIFLWQPFARAVYPLMIASQAMPKVAVAPLFLVWFGFGLLPKVLIGFLICFFPIVINTVMGLNGIEREKIYLAQSMGLGAAATFFKIRLPNALPAIFGGLKIAITLAVVGAVVGEFVGGDAGLGYLLITANGNMDTALLFAGIVCLTVIGVVLFLLVELAERLLLPRHAVGGGAARDSA